MHLQRLRHFVGASLALVAVSCGGEGESRAPARELGAWAGECERVPSLLEAAHACRRDDECPCAMACELGQCVSHCTQNSDCGAGTVCDAFGRCVLPAQANRPIRPGDVARGQSPASPTPQPSSSAAPPAPEPPVPLQSGAPALDRDSLELLTADAVASFRVAAQGGRVERGRVSAAEGLELDCDGSGAFVRECVLEALEPDAAPREIRVRAEGAWPDDDQRLKVTVFSGTATREVGVVKKGAPAAGARPRDGVYEGTAWLVGAGLSARTTEDTLPPELARLKLSVQARVFARPDGSYTVELDEPRRAVFPSGAVGTLALTNSATAWQLTVPSRQYLGDDRDAPDAAALDVHATETMSDATFRNGVLLGDLVVHFEGVTTPEYAPFARWRLSLSRSGPLSEGAVAPAVQERPVAAVATRATTPLPEEAGLAMIPGYGLLLPLEQAVAAWCTPAAAPAAVTGLSSVVDPRGDLQCGLGGTTQRAFSTSLGTLLDRGDYLDGCVRAFDPQSLSWGDVTAAAPCANRARAIATIATALGTDRERALGTTASPDLPRSRLGSRALQLWLGAQSITGSDPARLAALGPLLPSGSQVDKLRYYAEYDHGFDALRRSVAAWDPVLHPRVGVGLAAMAPQALQQPDYRDGFPGTTYSGSGGEQAVGLPVNMLAALTSQLGGVSALVDALANQRITSRDAQRFGVEIANFMPRSVVLFAMAQGLRDAARSHGAEPWENSWLAVRAKYGAALAKLSDDLHALESNKNPLGIEDGDLPLYRLGEQQGPSSRFSAVSDSLLGREDSSDPAIAPVLIDRAQDAELLARGSLSSVLARDYESELQGAAVSRNLEAVSRYYGEQVSSLCGLELSSLDVLAHADEIDANTCFIAPECLPSPAVAAARSSAIQTAHQVCLYAKYRSVLGDAITTFDAALDRKIDAIEGQFQLAQPLPALPADIVAGLSASKQPDGGLRVPATIDPSNILEARTLCDSARDASLAARPAQLPGTCATSDDCPVSMVCDAVSGGCTTPSELPESCFQGSLGRQLLALRAAAIEVEAAVDEFSEYGDRYAAAARSCALLEKSAEKAAELNRGLDRTMKRLEAAKLTMDIIEKTASVVREIAGTAATDPVKAASLGVQVAAGAVETAAFAISAGLQVKMDDTVREHEHAIDALDRNTEVAVCFNEAGMELIGAKAAQKRVERNQAEIRGLLYEFASMQGSVSAALSEGKASLVNEQARAVLPANADYWLDANVDLFEQRLRRARRALYLAILGVEYEFQLTSAERANVLAARNSAELEAILSRVRDSVRRGAPYGGGNPTELRSVLSLRKNVLQLADRRTTAAGWHQLADTERFQFLLVSPEFAVYDKDGSYLGQEIPFSLAPLGAAGLADASGIPLFSGLSCAERLWSVNAVVVGKELMVGTDSSMTSLQVRKRNTFESGWCSSQHGQEPQLASTRPGVNLFVDPLSAASWGEDSTLASLTSSGQTKAFSYATVQARANVDQATLESDGYTDGASVALAGRGAFGEYTLFIPRTSLATNGGAGLALENVEDILIRLDYVAAERQ